MSWQVGSEFGYFFSGIDLAHKSTQRTGNSYRAGDGLTVNYMIAEEYSDVIANCINIL